MFQAYFESPLSSINNENRITTHDNGDTQSTRVSQISTMVPL